MSKARTACGRTHGLDCAAALNGRLARAPPASRLRLAKLVDDLASAKATNAHLDSFLAFFFARRER